MFSLQNINLNSQEKQTFRLHFSYSLIEGIILGVFTLNEFVFIKSLKGNSYQLSVLFQFSTIVLIFSVFFNEFLRRIRNKRHLLRIVGIITRSPLLLLLFFPTSAAGIAANPIYHYIFLGIFLFYYMANPVIYPTINLYLKSNYRHEHFGRLYSISTIYNKLMMLIVTFLFGLLLDSNNYSFNYVYPVMALLSIISLFLFSNIEHIEAQEHDNRGFFQSIRDSWNRMFAILKRDKAYRDFEFGFMLYGFAFMSTVSVINIFFDKELHLNYSSVAFYKNIYNIIAILILPFFGRLIGRIDPRKFAAITFLSVALYLASLILTQYYPYYFEIFTLKIYYFMIFYILSQSLFAATMGLLWSIGSAYFCKDEESALYQSVHLTLTGERAIFAPILGVLFYEAAGFAFTFLIGIAALLLAVVAMWWSLKKRKALGNL